MTDKKVSALTDGTTANATDRIPVARSPFGSGDNAYITPAYLDTYMASTTKTLSNKTLTAPTLTGGVTFTGGTVTSSTPVVDATQTWNSGAVTFTGLKLNVTDTASAAASLLMDLQVGGASKASVKKDGTITAAGPVLVPDGSNASPTLAFSGATGQGFYRSGTATVFASSGADIFWQGASYLTMRSNMSLAWSSGTTAGSTQDTILTRAAAATLQLGAADAASPVAQTLQIQSVVAGTSNTAGANFTIAGSKGTGTGAGGSLIFQVAPAGSTGTSQNALATALTIDSTKAITTASYIDFGSSGSSLAWLYAYGGVGARLNSVGLKLNSATPLGWTSSSDSNAALDTILARDAANTLALRNSTNAQTFNVYNTYTDASNYEVLTVRWSGNVAGIFTNGLGSGTSTPRNLQLGSLLTANVDIVYNGSAVWRWSSGNLICPTDNTYDIGASGATRPRDFFLGRNAVLGGYVWPSYLRMGSGGNETRFYSAGNGIGTLYNAAETDFGRLQFGGTTSSFPALKRSSASLQVRLADDSDYAQHAAAFYTAAKAYTVAGLPAGTVGYIARVTDATAPAVGSTVVGGGAAAALVWYNGSAYTVIGV